MTNIEVIVYIKNNQTKEVVQIEQVLNCFEDDADFFIWEEGNYSCDCNRLLFFKEAKGLQLLNKDFHVKCSHGKFSIKIQEKESKKYLYKEYN